MNLLRLPILGALPKRSVRVGSQLVMLALATAIVVHGLFGPQIAPRNLSTVLTSIHWRGFLVLALLILGNLMCATCPIVLARDAGRRFATPRFSWPRALRRKWLAIVLLTLVLFSYELFDVWELPGATAWIVVGYFAAALAIDLLFKGASFCKHVCPVGQFNFIAATMSPAELRVSDEAICRSCRTYDCIRGQQSTVAPLPVVRRGCELGLFLPAKVGNLDCTMCLDCVRACPQDNISLATRVPGAELLDVRRRSGIGRLGARPDLAALAIVFTFAGLVNAFSMTAAAGTLGRAIAAKWNLTSEALVLAIMFAAGLLVLPGVLLACAAGIASAGQGVARKPFRAAALQYAPAFVPLGFGIWLAHYTFHLFTGVLTIVPVTQGAAVDLLGWSALGEPAWRLAGIAPGSVYPIQLGFVLLAACGSIALVHATSVRELQAEHTRASAPWVAVVVALAAAAVWVFTQPMDMRGVGGLG